MNPHTLDFKSPQSPITPKRRVHGEIQNSSIYINSPVERLKSPNISFERKSPLTLFNQSFDSKSPLIDRKSPLIERNLSSPLTSRSKPSTKYSTKISRIFEERSRFKMSNKENESTMLSETFVKLDVEEETRDCNFSSFRESSVSWSTTKLDFSSAIQTSKDMFVPEKDLEPDMDTDFETLHNLEDEFEADNFDSCTKYEIISTDSPNIISRGRSSTSRKVTSRNFVFGAPLADNEQSTSFDRPNNATRMLNFEDESFEFTSPAVRKTSSFVKKSLKFSETPTKNPLRHEKSDSSIGSMGSTPPSLRLFTSESTTSMESGFISELEEPFLDLEEPSNSPKIANFNELLSGQIKTNILADKNFTKRQFLHRSLSFNPEPKAKVSLFAIKESPEKKSQKRTECSELENISNKRRKGNDSPAKARPVLQRAFSENQASIMSALARSAAEPDLIGDFSQSYALPLAGGDHADLKSISSLTLAGLIRGEYAHSVEHFQIIDCRYPYEFEGGHIPGAVNMYTPAQVQTLLNKPLETRGPDEKRSILIFHCEFSLERGPKLYRYLRSSDRSKNMENYPHLNYPEIYLLHKGYRNFFQQYPELCSPNGYTAMLDPSHTQLLRKHRSVEEPTSFFTHHRSKPGHRLLY